MYLTKNSKSPFYQVIYEVNGKLTTRSTKQKLKVEALRFLSDFEKNSKKDVLIKNVLIEDFRKEYQIYLQETKSKHYSRSVEFSFRHFIKFSGNIFLKDVDIRLVENFIQSTYKKAKSTAGLSYRNLKAAFSAAVRWKYIKSNPFSSIKAPKQLSKFPIFISEKEIQIILKKVLNPQIKKMIMISYDTGLRLGETVNLKFNNIDLQQKIIKVSNSNDFQTKSKQDRIIPLTDRLYKMFLELAPNVFTIGNNSEYVFKTKNKVRYNLDYISRSFKRAVRDTNVNQAYTYHTLRHSFASNLAQAGVSLYIISKLLGHQNLKTTQIYAHLQPKNLFEAVDKLNNIAAH